MRKFQSRPEIRFSPGAYFLLALMLFLLPLKWIGGYILAAAWHEGCHLLALGLCSGEVSRLQIGAAGAVIESGPLSRGKELLCALAGPIGGLLLLPFARWIPRTAVCAVFQSLYNLLPVYPLDGGRALSCLAFMVFPPLTAERFCRLAEFTCLCAIGLGAAYATFVWKLGVMPLLFAWVLILRVKKNSLQTAAREGTIVLP